MPHQRGRDMPTPDGEQDDPVARRSLVRLSYHSTDDGVPVIYGLVASLKPPALCSKAEIRFQNLKRALAAHSNVLGTASAARVASPPRIASTKSW